MVIEIKKLENNRNRDFDFEKLKAFTSQLKYEFGFYLEFNENSISDFKIFKNGKKQKWGK